MDRILELGKKIPYMLSRSYLKLLNLLSFRKGFPSVYYDKVSKTAASAKAEMQTHDERPEDDFSAEFYLAAYPDVAASRMSPYEHYVKHGRAEGRLGRLTGPDGRPYADFSPEFYLAAYPDVVAAGMNAYEHYVRHGRDEGRLGSVPGLANLGRAGSIDNTRETVLVVSHDGARGGAPILSYNIVKGLLKKYNVVALFLGPGPIPEACRQAGAVVIGPVVIREATPLTEVVVAAMAELTSFKFALANSIEARHVLPAFAKRYIPTVTLIHEFAAYIRPHSAFREAVFWSGQVVFSSKVTRDNAVTEYPDLGWREYPVIPQGRCVVPGRTNGADRADREEAERIQRSLRPEGFSSSGVVILAAGSVEYRKGVDLFIDCAARVLRRAPDLSFRFVWIGKGYDPDRDVAYSVYLEDQVRRSGLDKHVIFLKEVSDLAAAYDAADLFVLTSRLDPLPNVAIDALTIGLPIVCFRKASGIAEFLEESDLGQHSVAAYLDTDDMALKLIALSQSRELRAQLAEKCAAVAATTFNMERYVGQLEQLALQQIEYAEQERVDVQTIEGSDLPRLDYHLLAGQQNQARGETIRAYVRSCASGVGHRKLLPGFHPAIYVEQHGIEKGGANPLADYIRAGQPQGPWSFILLTDATQPKPIPPGVRIGLHIHAYYTDIFPEILARLEQNKVRPDLLISVTSEEARAEIKRQLVAYSKGQVDIRVVPNRGRDIGPFLTEFGESLKQYDLIGHLHTKKTADIPNEAVGKSWYRFLLENLLGGSVPMADIILGQMAQDRNIGMVFPDDPHVVGWDKNKHYVTQYSSALAFKEFPESLNSPVGTMFWARPASIMAMLNLGLQWADYPPEPLPYDGSLLHGLERLFGLAVGQAGYSIVNTNVAGVTR